MLTRVRAKGFLGLTLVIALTLARLGLSDSHAATPPKDQTRPPNVLIIIADDMGYADISSGGGEIPTPNIDSIGNRGLKLTRFYTSIVCSPTRAMLVSGVDNHRSGLGSIREMIARNQRGQEGYEGFLSRNVASIAEQLKAAGYRTYITGKWHLGTEVDQSPLRRGFDRSFVLLGGGGSHFKDMAGVEIIRQVAKYNEDGREVYELPKTFFSSDYYTDKLLNYIDSERASGKPFLGILSFTAPHWPQQAPNYYIGKYKGKYDAGWDVLRRERFERMKRLRLIPQSAQIPPLPPEVKPWNDLSKDEQVRQARLMEIYAGMVDNMDLNVGRVLSYLQREGQLQNTVVVFLSDNGADGFMSSVRQFQDFVSMFDNRIENLGKEGSYAVYGGGWAQAGEAPFYRYKGFMTEGGARKLGLVAAPGVMKPGTQYDGPVSVLDIAPTILDLARAMPLQEREGRRLFQPQGHSLRPLIEGRGQFGRTDNVPLGMEQFGQTALIKGDWKLRRIPVPNGTGEWELFNVALDPGEQRNLAQFEAARMKDMLKDWDRYVRTNNVIVAEGAPQVVE
jgi:arylsulfatase